MRWRLNRDIFRSYFMREIGYETVELWKVMLENRLLLIMPAYEELYRSTLFELDLENPYLMVTTHAEGQKDNRGITRGGLSEGSGLLENGGTRDTEYGRTETTTYGRKEQNHLDQKIHTTDTHFDMPQVRVGMNQDLASSMDEKDEKISGDPYTQLSGNDTAKLGGKDSIKDNSKVLSEDSQKWNDRTDDILQRIQNYTHTVKGHQNNLEILEAIEKWRSLIININHMIVDDISDLFMRVY